MAKLTDSARAAISAELSGAAHGQRTATADRLAATYGVSRSMIYDAAALKGTPRPRARRIQDVEEWVRTAVRRAHLAPDPVPLDLAVRACVAAGELPPEAGDVPIQTLRRVRRELGLVQQPKRTRRLSAQWPMQVLLVDGSTSNYLTIVDAHGEDDWRLRLHRKPVAVATGYKNKPVSRHRLRLQVVGVWDRCTGLSLARYHAARGEDAVGVASALCFFLAGGHPAGMPLRGVPDEVWSDGGSLVRSNAARDLLERLDVNVDRGPPYVKYRQGGVERPWRTQWLRFERSLFMLRSPEILLSELNARLMRYCVEEGRRPARTAHPDGRRWSRADAFAGLLHRRPAPLRELPDNPMRTLARTVRRKIDSQGIVRVDGKEFECPDWHSKWVSVRLALASGDGGRIVVEDDATGERRECPLLVPTPHGEIKAVPATALDKLLAEDAPEWPGADVYGGEEPTSNVVPLPPKTAPAAELDDPLDADRLPSIDAAMLLLAERCPGLSAAALAKLRAAIERTGASRAAVEDLAAEIAASVGGGG